MMASPLSLRFKAKNMVEVRPRLRRRDVACRLLNVAVASTGILVTAPVNLDGFLTPAPEAHSASQGVSSSAHPQPEEDYGTLELFTP